MKTNWPACRLACTVLVSIVVVAGPIAASPGPVTPVVRVDAQVSAKAVRIDTKASGPFQYTTMRPSDHLLVVDLHGVVSTDPASARVLRSDLVSSYRLVSYGSGQTAGVRLEILLRRPVEPRVERGGPDQLSLVFDEKAAPVARNPAAPVTRAAGASASTRIAQIHVAREGEQTSVRVEATGRLVYDASRMDHPDRLVLDFAGARLAIARNSIPSALKPVRGIRVSQFRPDVARVVIDLESAVPYAVKAEGKSLIVAFAAPAAAPAKTPATAPARAAPLPNTQTASAQPSGSPIEISGMPLPASLTQRTAVLGSLGFQSDAAKAASAPASSPGPVVSSPQLQPASAQDAAAQAQTPAPSKKYSGEPISVNLKDVDLKDFFRLIHEISGLNVVLDPAVKGTVTLVLDEVPWDQALDIVMRNNGLDKQLDGNVLRVATQDTIKKEAETRRDLAKAQAEAVDQVTATRVLSYAKATGLRDTLKRFLSARGEILADERSNTLIIRDIPSVLPAVDNLIRQLDRKSQQVEIEARVVAASRSFARDIGTQFGFATSAGKSVFGGNAAVGSSPIFRTVPPLPMPPLISGAPPIPSSTGPPVPINVQIPFNTNLGAGGPTSGLTYLFTSPNLALDFIISAAETKGVGKLLSKPKVITQNNEKATVKQGTKIPVQTTINNTISVQFVDAVLKLEVTPQVTAEGTVFMEVVVENTQIDTGIPRVQGIPALNTQSAETKVLINDGGTVVIGGVIISSQRTDISQVPVIGSIPLIGNLFKRTTVNVQSQELLFFLTPRIVPG